MKSTKYLQMSDSLRKRMYHQGTRGSDWSMLGSCMTLLLKYQRHLKMRQEDPSSTSTKRHLLVCDSIHRHYRPRGDKNTTLGDWLSKEQVSDFEVKFAPLCVNTKQIVFARIRNTHYAEP